ncbi:hypothetical protein TRICI_004858 [Trichomonascus ciferrii]|uniref:Uncharacterized protein n=1 Tax=Trichomonascus ciferrii TaxID=44093 RepID=A0A642V3U4_9ASCO|nr:hypothetical protein TRICI_004858 [Trichomonascus ciferrii]
MIRGLVTGIGHRRLFSTRGAVALSKFQGQYGGSGRRGPFGGGFRQQQQTTKLPADGKLTVGYVLHGQFTRNNTILTLTRRYRRVGKKAEHMSLMEQLIEKVRPQQEVKLSLSTGQLGYRNTKQGEYEAAFQTAARMFKLMEERGYTDKELELVFRQFADGREAFLNALNGKEGNKIRPLVSRVTDGTRIRFGGSRPPNKRRL